MREDWSEVRLGEVLTLDIDRVPVASQGSYRIAGVYSFSRGLFHRESIRGTETAYPALHRLREGQLVISRLKAWEGATAPVTAEFHGSFLSPEFPTFTPTEALGIDYLGLITQQPSFWEALRQRAVGVGGRKSRVKADVFLHTVVRLPPTAEQRRIVALVARADAQHAAATRLAQAAAAARRFMAETLLERIVTDAPLGEVVDVMIGRQRSPAHAEGEHMALYLRAANVKAGYLTLDDVKEMNFASQERARYGLAPGDVLVTEGCGSLQQLGASAVYQGEIGGDVCFQNTLLRLRAKAGMTVPEYAEVLARWAFDTGRFAALAKGTNIFHLGAKRAQALLVPLPDLDEQRSIAALLRAVDAAAKAAVHAATRTREARGALVSSLLSGTHAIPVSYDALLEAASSNEPEAA